MFEIELVAYSTIAGRQPFKEWADSLPVPIALRIGYGLDKLRQGNTGAMKSLGGGLFEMRFHFGAGYRVYCGQEGRTVVILLGGGDKDSQDRDIAKARAVWTEYKSIREKR